MADDAGSLLVRAGLITAQELVAARAAQTHDGGTIAEHLVAHGGVGDDRITEFYRTRLLVPQVHPNTLARLSAATIAIIPPDMALEFRAIPVTLDKDDNLTLVMSDPSDRHAVDEIAFFTRKYVIRAVATQMQIAWCLAQYYGYVTELGERLLQPMTTASAERQRGHTGQIQATRHRVVPPATIPPPAVVTPAAADDAIEELDNSAMDVDDETAPAAATDPAPAAKGTLPGVAAVSTGEATQPRRKRPAIPDPPELAARSGELESHIDDRPIDNVPSVEVHFDDEPVESVAAPASGAVAEMLDGTESRPILLHQFLAAHTDSSPVPTLVSDGGRDEASGPVVLLERKKVGDHDLADDMESAVPEQVRSRPNSSPPRAVKHTVIGIGALGPIPRPQAAIVNDSTADAVQANTNDAVPMFLFDDHAETQRIAPRFATSIDDEWGAPGTTIPPQFIGATIEDDLSGAVVGHVGPPSPAPALVPDTATGPTGPARQSGNQIADASELAQQLEAAADRLVQVMRDLDRVDHRDEAISLLVQFVIATHRRVSFLTLKSNHLVPFLQIPQAQGGAPHLELDFASTFQDIMGTRLPYRGPVADDPTRELIKAMFGSTTDEMLAVPVAVRSRVIGIIYADGRSRYAFDEHVMAAARAAGLALERIMRSKKT